MNEETHPGGGIDWKNLSNEERINLLLTATEQIADAIHGKGGEYTASLDLKTGIITLNPAEPLSIPE